MRGIFGFDSGLDLDLKSFLRTGFLTGSERKIWIGLESKIFDMIFDFFQPLSKFSVSLAAIDLTKGLFTDDNAGVTVLSAKVVVMSQLT